MAESDQANSQLAVDEEGRLLETPKKDLSQEQMDKLEADLKESIDQLKETVIGELEEKKADDKEQLPRLGEEELLAVLESKIVEDKEDCLEALKLAGGVEKTKVESLYKTLFGMIIKGSVDAILKKEVIHLTAEMCQFRNNIAKKLPADEEITDDTPLDLLKVPQGFEDAWKVWKKQKGNKDREELSYKALRNLIMVIED